MFKHWHRVGTSGIYVNLNKAGWRIRLTARMALLERRRPKLAKHQRFSGVWQRVGRFERPIDAEEYTRLEGWIDRLLTLNLERPDAWEGKQCNRRRPSTGRGRKVKNRPGMFKAVGWKPATGARLTLS